MKIKHNKKRNTAFLYETLMVELTKSILSENAELKSGIMEMLSAYFASDTALNDDLSFYRALNETAELDPYTAEKLIFEVKSDRQKTLDEKKLFNEQTSLINVINRRLTKKVFSNFVPGYKNIATISQIFNADIGTKQRVLLEKELINKLISSTGQPSKEDIVQIDNLVYHTFTKKFNDKYQDSLLSEQKRLLSNYIMSFADNSVGLKLFVGKELDRLSEAINSAKENGHIAGDSRMRTSSDKVLQMIERFKSQPVTEETIRKILKIQELVSEVKA